MDFTNKHQPRPPGRRPPPNYLSPSLQRRLLMTVGALLLVFVLMVEARKSKNWEWMWAGTNGPRNEQIDTRLSVEPAAAGGFNTALTAGHTQQIDWDQIRLPPQDTKAAFRELVWRHCLDQLDHQQRVLLDRLLKVSRSGPPASPLDQDLWARLSDRLNSAWTSYLEQAGREVAGSEVSSEQRDSWRAALNELQQEWNRRYALLFSPTRQPDAWTESARAQLAALQAVIDRLDLKQIEDDTVWRGAEQHAWFRLLERLQQSTADRLAQHSAGPASFVQLFRQPDEYRAKLVTVKGRAKLAYRVPTPPNIHGIDSYYIFWLRPAGGQRSPIVVYSLQAPPDFPAITDRSQGETTSLDEEVAFDAFFFKRWAYRAQDGINTAPLLLAKIPRWQPSADRPASAAPTRWGRLAPAIVAVACLSLGLAYLAYAVHRRPARHGLAKSLSSKLGTPDEEETPVEVRRFLHRLALQHETKDP